MCRYRAYGPINVKVVTGSEKKITINRKGTICEHIKDHNNTSFVATTNTITVSTSHQPPLTISSLPSLLSPSIRIPSMTHKPSWNCPRRKTLETLPDEMKLECIKYLGGMDIIRLSMVNELFHSLCEDEFVWKAKCMDEFGFNWSSEELSISYKKCYKRLCKPSVALWGYV